MRYLSLLMISAIVTLANAADDSSARKALEVRAREFETALKKKDITWFQNTATPDFVAIDKGKKAGLKDALAGIQMLFAMAKSIDTASSKITSLKVSGSTAHVTSVTKMSGKMAGNKGKTARFTDDNRTDEIWVLVGGKWKIKQEKMVSDKMTLNGKPFNQGM